MLYLYLIIFAQTILESIPVSSSGHIALLTILFQKYFDLQPLDQVLDQQIFESWIYCLHGITALVLAIFFFPKWFFFVKHLFRVWRIVIRLIFLVGIVDVITFIGYFLVRHFDLNIPLYVGFCITGIALASLKSLSTMHTQRSLGIRDAVILGGVQSIALLPGISRFASTFVVARWLGYSNKRAFELTWMIQWPLIFAAAILGFYKLYEIHAFADFVSFGLMFAYVFAGIGAYAALYFVQWCIYKDKMWWFAYYMIVPTLVAFGLVI